jgi:hypothetical protein
MGFKELLSKVEASSIYADFVKEHSDAELVAGFFIMDFMSNDNKESIDYKIGEKVFTFNLKRIVGNVEGVGDEGNDDGGEVSDGDDGGEGIGSEKIVMYEDKLVDDPSRPSLVKIDREIKVEVEELKSIAGTKALDEGISAKFSKIIAVLQKYDGYGGEGEGRQIWNLTCMLEGLIILNIHVDALSGDVLKFERKGMMDLIKRKG